MAIRITIWNENEHERRDEAVRRIYPAGIHGAIATGIVERLGDSVIVTTATLDEPDQGLPDEVLNQTDVLLWWGHIAHNQVADTLVDRVQQRVLSGMGLIVLHSGHHSKIFRRLMGTSCNLRYREAGEMERVWCVNPGHPIADGLPDYFEIPETEMYGEHFDIPEPDELVFISWYQGGEVFRSGCCYRRGKGKIFYFAPGHETYPIYHNHHVRHVIANAVRWCTPNEGSPYLTKCPNIREPLNPWR